MSNIPEYEIGHIADLSFVPLEHLDEMMECLKRAAVNMHIMRLCLDNPESREEMRAALKSFRFKPDGLMESTGTLTDESGKRMQIKIEPDVKP